MRPRVGKEFDATRTQVFALRSFGFRLEADIAHQSGQHGHMQLFVSGRLGV